MNLTPEQVAARLALRNPFATRSVRPGALNFRLHNGLTLGKLVDQLREQDWLGEITGPHGSGKSTLVHSLIPLLEEAGRDVKLYTTRRGESRLPVNGSDIQSWDARTQIVIDGYEQLGGWTRTLINRVCRKGGSGLILTAHESTGTPCLFRTCPDIATVQGLVRDMQNNGSSRITDADVSQSFARQQGNVREVFFELYDLYEQRRGDSEIPPPM